MDQVALLINFVCKVLCKVYEYEPYRLQLQVTGQVGGWFGTIRNFCSKSLIQLDTISNTSYNNMYIEEKRMPDLSLISDPCSLCPLINLISLQQLFRYCAPWQHNNTYCGLELEAI